VRDSRSRRRSTESTVSPSASSRNGAKNTSRGGADLRSGDRIKGKEGKSQALAWRRGQTVTCFTVDAILRSDVGAKVKTGGQPRAISKRAPQTPRKSPACLPRVRALCEARKRRTRGGFSRKSRATIRSAR